MNGNSSGVKVIDTHTGGEPTRVVIEGGPDLGDGPFSDRVDCFRKNFDHFRRMLIDEPRGHEAMVGALLCEPVDKSCAAGVIFFNNRGYLGMCGHGTMGVVVTLGFLGRIEPGKHRLETPVGIIALNLLTTNRVAVENVVSYRLQAGVEVYVEGLGTMTGDVAWGGNWFFLARSTPFPLSVENIGRLSNAALQVRNALSLQGIRGSNGAEIDHIEFFGPAVSADASSRNFVLCPGGAYDRSPCGTGTSAKLACLAADRKLAPGATWIQESIIGSRFTASYRYDSPDRIVPTIAGDAFVVGESRFVLQSGDPFPYGIAAGQPT